MPLHLGQGAEDVDDDDKALFVKPDPPLTHIFHLEITPPSLAPSSGPTATDHGSPSLSVTSSPPASPMSPVEFVPESPAFPIQSRPHGKRRDPSYIPRPPNAFILFRSAFIRDQNIPGKVEGNHSKLSKIIGLCWKQLSAEEREKWEARAVDAQAEHRTRYPDWRFRPGANARLKAGESSLSATRRRSVRGRTRSSPSKDGEEGEPESKPKDKGKSKSKTGRMPSIEETRCVKIASFVAEGLKGQELEIAVRQWEDDRRIARPEIRPKKPRTQKSRATLSKAPSGSQSSTRLSPSFSPVESHSASSSSTPTHPRLVRTPTIDDSKSATSANNAGDDNTVSLSLSTVPLTHMFKRHPSTSVSEKRLSSLSDRSDESSLEDATQTSAESEPHPRTWGTIAPEKAPKRTHTDFHIRDGSLPIPSTSSTTTFHPPHLAWHGRENQHHIEEIQTSHSWWHRRSTPVESPSDFNFDSREERDSGGSMVFGPEHMGYETHGSERQYDPSFVEQYRSYEPPQDGSQHIQWTDLSAPGMNRQGLGIIIEDPYKHDCNDASSRSISEPSTLSIAPPPSSSSSFYYSSRPTPSSLPSSSYSALSGWAGDYKSHPIHEGSIKNWPEHPLANASPTPSAIAESSPAWYNEPEMYNWSATRSQLQHNPLSVESHEWDRHEERVASHMNHRVESRRHLDFHDQHGGS